jgi:hypothetical protein
VSSVDEPMVVTEKVIGKIYPKIEAKRETDIANGIKTEDQIDVDEFPAFQEIYRKDPNFTFNPWVSYSV